MTEWDCLLHGGYAGGTVGDEVALAVALKDARERFGPRVGVLTRAPDYTLRIHGNVSIIPYDPVLAKHGLLDRWLSRGGANYRPEEQIGADGRPLPWVEAVRQSTHLYLVGGGYFNDVWDIHFPLLPARVAEAAGVAVSTAPVQVGPFFGSSSSRYLTQALKDSSIRVRDMRSRDVCNELGLEGQASADDVFRALEVIDGWERKPSPGERSRIGVCIFRQNGCAQPAFDLWWTEFLRALAGAAVDIEGFAFHNYPGYDAADSADLFSKAGLDSSSVRPPPEDFRDAARTLCRYDAVISCRFHAVVISSLLDIPAIAFADGPYYKQKMTAVWPNDVPRFVEAGLETPATETAVRLVDMSRVSK